MPAKFRKTNISAIWNPHIQSELLILAFAGVSLGIAQFVALPEIVYVLGIVVLSLGYRFKRLS